jgi:cytochrome c-type biogenesis protein CcmH/NrfG
MGLLSNLLFLPAAPARFAAWAVNRVIDAATEARSSPMAIRRDLAELWRQLDEGVISPDEFDRLEDEILDRLVEDERKPP